MSDSAPRAAHWDKAYERAPDAVSWFQQEAQVSLELIEAAALAPDQPIIDVGGGASTLVDGLLKAGHRDISVLDVTGKALDAARTRLGSAAAPVHCEKWSTAPVPCRPRRRRY